MKKLIIAMVVAVIATFVNAGAVNWGSGAVQSPGDGGVLSGSRLTNADGFTLTVYGWESLAASSLTFDAGDLYAWYSKGASASKDPFGNETALTAISGSVNMGASSTTSTISGSVLTTTGGDMVYAAVLFVLSDADTGKDLWYIENTGSVAAKAGTTKASLANLALKVGGGSSTVPTAWIAVPADIPEPTSGVLMLLGMAGLALRRRRA